MTNLCKTYAYKFSVCCRSFFCRTWSQPFTTWYMVYLYLPGPEEPPEWVDIPVGCGGDAIRVDLRGEVVR